jgi:hypothetical protein
MFTYDYYVIGVPGDLAESMQELAEQAIAEAREKARLYCMPCEWSAHAISGEVGGMEVRFKVRRKRNKN